MNDRVNSSEREAALLGLDAAYARFLEQFRSVPDEALSFVPDGEEYTLGILPEHLCDPLWSYSSQLDTMVRSGFAPLDLTGDGPLRAAKAHRHRNLASWRPSAGERESMLSRLDTAHLHARSRLAALDAESFTRAAPVVYSTGDAPLATSPSDIAGWLQAHYEEHTEQTAALLTQWQATARP
jgi:hypothetical protein